MSVFDRVRALLRPEVDRTYAADIKPLMDFSTVDLEKIRTDLAIVRRGAERGAQNEPPSNASGLDEVELEIVNAVSSLRNEGFENYHKQTSAYDGRLARLDLRTIVPQIKTMLHDAEADFGAAVTTDTNYVFAKKDEVTEAQAAYDSFRGRHRLDRLPELEKNPILAFGILLVIFLAETVANSGFFSATHPGGWLGAVFEAAAISVINLAIGFILGIFALRYIRLPSFLWRLPMGILTVFLVGFAIIFNVFAAHYRDAFALVPPEADNFMLEASRLALSKLISAKYALVGFQSYLMVLVGLLVVTYASYKGLAWLDPYPGYGAVYRRHLFRRNEYLRLIDELVRNLQDRKDQAIAELRESIADIRRRDEEYGVVISERSRLTHRFNSYQDSLERGAEALLAGYRGANRKARTEPQPQTFGQPWRAGWSREVVLGDTSKEERRTAVEELLSAIAVSQTKLLEAFNGALKEYEKLRDFGAGARPSASAAN
ncbi:MAG: phage holin family protein [Enhydrobacter sp.]|nr:MAG: phage holin family protein [Enhydrobacter sp.]